MINKLNKIFRVLLILIGLYYLMKYGIEKNTDKVFASLCVPILVILPEFFKKFINNKLIVIYYLYIFILLILGCLSNFYSIYKYYDVFAHFMFGFAGGLVTIYLLNYFKIINNSVIFNVIFMISITLALASCWEIFEYFSSLVFKNDAQDVLKTGVRDTMEDIIASLIASILFAFIYLFKRDKINYLVQT